MRSYDTYAGDTDDVFSRSNELPPLFRKVVQWCYWTQNKPPWPMHDVWVIPIGKDDMEQVFGSLVRWSMLHRPFQLGTQRLNEQIPSKAPRLEGNCQGTSTSSTLAANPSSPVGVMICHEDEAMEASTVHSYYKVIGVRLLWGCLVLGCVFISQCMSSCPPNDFGNYVRPCSHHWWSCVRRCDDSTMVPAR